MLMVVAFGNTPDQRYLGHWPDGSPMRELEVLLPGVFEGKAVERAAGVGEK